jgi:hypothetical protein
MPVAPSACARLPCSPRTSLTSANRKRVRPACVGAIPGSVQSSLARARPRSHSGSSSPVSESGAVASGSLRERRAVEKTAGKSAANRGRSTNAGCVRQNSSRGAWSITVSFTSSVAICAYTAAPLAARAAIEESRLWEERNDVRSNGWAADGAPDCTCCCNRVCRGMARLEARLTLQDLPRLPICRMSRRPQQPRSA